MKNKAKNVRKGFTLVELLIVIVVIGILSAMMMLSSTEAVTSSKVSNIVSNLRNLKTAALAYYADKIDTFTLTPDLDLKDYQADIRKYLSGNTNGTDIPDISDYTVSRSSNNGQQWYVIYNIKQSNSDADVALIKRKLAGRAKSSGLKGATMGSGNMLSEVEDYSGQDYVVMHVR